MTTKLDREVASDGKMLSTKSHKSSLCLLNLKWWWLMRRGYHHNGTWHNSRVTHKRCYISVFKKAHDYQTRQVTWFFDHVIACSLMTNKICYISNSTNAMDTKLDRLVAYDIGKTLKKWHRSCQKVLTIYVIFIHLRIAPLILHRATIRLLLLIREKQPPILTFLVTLHEIHGSIW